MSLRKRFKLRLYVAAGAMNSVLATANLRALCQGHLADRYELEIVDVFAAPRRALADGIYMTPTLIKLAPAPVLRMVGTLGDAQLVLQALGLEALAA